MGVGVGEHWRRLHSEDNFWKFQDPGECSTLVIFRMPDVNTENLRSSASPEYSLSYWNITLLFNFLSHFPSNFRASCFPTHSTFVENFLLEAYFYMNGFQLRKGNYLKTCISSSLRQNCSKFNTYWFQIPLVLKSIAIQIFSNINGNQANSYTAGSHDDTFLLFLDLYTKRL